MKSSRAWELVLYPDAENYCCDKIIANASQYFEQWAYILHDSDITADGDTKKPTIISMAVVQLPALLKALQMLSVFLLLLFGM